MKKKDLVRVQLLLDSKLFEQLRRQAFETKTSNSKIARHALRQFLTEIKQ